MQGGGLAAHEAAGGHLLARHVGLSGAALDARGISVASTFLSRAEAEAAATAALSQNGAQIATWLQGTALKLELTTPFTGGLLRVAGGYEAAATSASFVLKRTGSGGFFILTGFPTP